MSSDMSNDLEQAPLMPEPAMWACDVAESPDGQKIGLLKILNPNHVTRVWLDVESLDRFVEFLGQVRGQLTGEQEHREPVVPKPRLMVPGRDMPLGPLPPGLR